MSKPSLLVVSPLPPAWSGIANYTDQMLGSLARDWKITVMIGDGEEQPRDIDGEMSIIHRSSERWLFAVEPPQRILHHIGNSAYHLHVPDLVARHGGVVLAHDVRMNALQCFRAFRSNSQNALSTMVERRHGSRLADEFRSWEARGGVTKHFHEVRSRLDEINAYLLGAAVEGADAIAVHSEFARRIALTELPGSTAVSVVPFGHRPTRPRQHGRIGQASTVSTFGFVAPEKNALLLIEAFATAVNAQPGLQLRFVGHVDPAFHRHLLDRAAQFGVSQAVHFTGRVTDTEYLHELEIADVAVQLRALANGEASAAIADCLSASAPTLVTDFGAQGALPNDAVWKVPFGIDPQGLANEMLLVLGDSAVREQLSARARSYADANSFDNAASALTTLLLASPATR